MVLLCGLYALFVSFVFFFSCDGQARVCICVCVSVSLSCACVCVCVLACVLVNGVGRSVCEHHAGLPFSLALMYAVCCVQAFISHMHA